MKKSRNLILLGSLLLVIFSKADVLSQKTLRNADTANIFQKYESTFLQIVRPGSSYDLEHQELYPFWAKPFLNEFFKYNPIVEELPEAKECALPGDQSVALYLSRCESRIQTGPNGILSNTYLTMMLKLNPGLHPYARYVVFNLPNGVKVKGLLALKGDGKKRPFIILRTGIFSNVTQFLPERYLFMQLFEQSNFNMLVLESTSGHEYILRNQEFALGGYDEGIQNYQLARTLKSTKEPLSKIIESIHLAGISLGGHGVLFASLLSDINPGRVISSSLALCPLVNFRDTLDYHMSQGMISKAINYWASHRLKGVEKFFPQIDFSNFLESLMFYLDKNYQGARALDNMVLLPKELKESLKNYWKQNNYWTAFHNIKTPILIFATKDDPIVPYALNSERFVRNYIDIGKSNLHVQTLNEGWHCSLPGAYQWRPMATLFQKHILNHSAFQPERQVLRFNLNSIVKERILNYGFHPHAVVSMDNNTLLLRIVFLKKPVSKWTLLFGAADLFFESPFVPSDIGYSAVKSSVDIKIYERWFQQNLHYSLEGMNSDKSVLLLEWAR